MARSKTGAPIPNQGARFNKGGSNARSAAAMPKSVKKLPAGGARSETGKPFGGLRPA